MHGETGSPTKKELKLKLSQYNIPHLAHFSHENLIDRGCRHQIAKTMAR